MGREGVLHNYMEFCDWSIRAIQRDSPFLSRCGHETSPSTLVGVPRASKARKPWQNTSPGGRCNEMPEQFEEY